ncbi:PREDICTED: protein sidekick-2-like [Thamnophis sirtalis]|uniref:Protein sidekick-2-like n=1 Tax=Thamnophis sirtalis TaxID=35019 RepID=A0A6I9YUX2_9SAUR|nr:PREDICTED: protein sidekick-2-like [Thamnophis sirtalis]
MQNLSEASLTQYELDNLNKHRRYEIRMSVYNAVGEGPTSSPQEVFVGEAVPTAAPQNVVIQTITATQLDITWEPPPPETQNGDIQGYKRHFGCHCGKQDIELKGPLITVVVYFSSQVNFYAVA